MRIVSDVYSELGKTFLNLGQAVMIAAIVAQFFTPQPVGWFIVLVGILMAVVLMIIGLVLIQRAYRVKHFEELKDG